MAIIVDKLQKRKDIALSCKDLLISKGIKSVSISDLAKSAGVSKGSIYDYFENKEDIVFEVFNILLLKHNKIKEQKIDSVDSIKDKVKMFFSFFYDEEERELRVFFRDFISVLLSNPSDTMLKFQTDCYRGYYEWFESIINDGIQKGELKSEAKGIVYGLFTFGKGVFIVEATTNTKDDIQKRIDDYIDTIFDLIEIKER